MGPPPCNVFPGSLLNISSIASSVGGKERLACVVAKVLFLGSDSLCLVGELQRFLRSVPSSCCDLGQFSFQVESVCRLLGEDLCDVQPWAGNAGDAGDAGGGRVQKQAVSLGSAFGYVSKQGSPQNEVFPFGCLEPWWCPQETHTPIFVGKSLPCHVPRIQAVAWIWRD